MFRPWKVICAFPILTLLTLPMSAPAADLSVTSVTSGTLWDEEDGIENSSASEYLNFHSRGKLGGFRLDMEGYGRFTQIDEEVEPGDGDADRLYVLALILSDKEGRNELTMGRQFIAALVGPEMIDGLSLKAQAGKAAFNARWGYKSDVSSSSDEDKVLGFGFDYNIKQGMYLSLDYGRTSDDRLLTELLAAEWIYSWHRFTKAYINFNWDLMSETLHESLVGTRLYFSDRFSTVFELVHKVPTFDSDSIYSVFAVDAAFTRSFSLLFTPTRNTRYVWDYIVESYQGGGGGRRYEVSGHWTPGRSRIDCKLLQHSGYGGDLLEMSASASTPILENLDVGIGGDFARTENPGEDSVQSSLAYISGKLGLSTKASMDLRLERCNDELTEPTQTGRLALKVEF